MTPTNAEVRTAKTLDRDYKLSDTKGLYLYRATSGSKTWRYKYRYGAKERTLTIGSYPEFDLAEAREHHHEARRPPRDGTDPALEAQRKKQALISAV